MTRTPSHPFERSVLSTIARHLLLRTEDRVLVALSGGPDSTALLATLQALAARGRLAGVMACHVDHRLRRDSGSDADFCAELCAGLDVPLHRVSLEVPREGNLQAAARRERYRALRRIGDACGATVIATGHTRSDQAETVLQRLLRGAGARGLAGIPIRRGRIVRPLLERSRAEVLGYLEHRAISAREDPTNRSSRFVRNRIRHEVLPTLEALAPGVERRLARTAGLLREDDRLLERLARALVPGAPTGSRDEVRVSIAALRAAPLAVRRRAVRRLWRLVTGSRRGLSSDHVDGILSMLRRRSPASIDLPEGISAAVAYGSLELRRGCAPDAPAFAPIVVSREGAYAVPGRGVIELRWDAPTPAPWPLEVRTRRPGDRFRPAGGRGGKKLKAWLIDRKVPRARRDLLLVVAGRDGSVLCLPELDAVATTAAGLTVRLRPGP